MRRTILIMTSAVLWAWLASGCESSSPPSNSNGKSPSSKSPSNDSDSDEDEDTDGSSGTDSSNCSGSDSSSDPSCGGNNNGGSTSTDGSGGDPNSGSDPATAIVDVPEKAACHAKGRAFFREVSTENPRGRCHDSVAYPASFKCDREGVIAAFGKFNAQYIKTALDGKLSQGYFIDDCGLLNNKAAVFLSCFHRGDGVCVPPNQVESLNSIETKVTMVKCELACS